MVAWKLVVEYDGSRYHGWQEQKNAPRTVLGALRQAAEDALGVALEMQGAGRTDTGVHALGQVLHVKGNPRGAWSAEALRDAINQRLGHDIAVLSVEEVPLRFHARHHAAARSYLYRISLRKNAFAKRHVWWVKEALDARAMQAAVALLPGRHDFSAFRADDPSRPDDSPIVVVESASLSRLGEEWQFRITASHFVWRQVRRITGALVQIGLGHMTLEDFRAALSGDLRQQARLAAATAPAAGLFLEAVRYPEDLDVVMKPARKQTASAPRHRSGNPHPPRPKKNSPPRRAG
ncbi:MAG: tRNA pseudouridine(38-40) synthase TruA [Bryobacterales bacterium]|jgi:tRNA pseudouridine38-40 synthase|nr:tRNA pseudouridine(38-40) synthase TruA [Bryobacterales bacterium]